MPDIWTPDRLYYFLRPYVDLCTRLSFRRIDTIGQFPEFQEGSAYIFASNHTHTLMDALMVLQGRKEATAFGARADVFRNPTAAKGLRFCKIVPLARKDRERPEEVARNRETLEEIDRILAHGVPFCLFPEGRHRTMHSLLPMRRGVARMANTSAAERPTFIVPIGLEYSDWFHFRGHARMSIGQPIDINALYATLEGQGDSERDRAIQDLLYERLASLIYFIPDDEHYEERLADAESARRHPSALRRILLGALTFPFFALSAILALPLWGLAEYLCRFKVKDPAFQNTARFGVKLVGTPVFFLLWAILLFCLCPWWLALVLLAAYLPSMSIFYDWLNLVCGRTLPPLARK